MVASSFRLIPGRELVQRTNEVSAGAEPSFVGGMTTDTGRVASVRLGFENATAMNCRAAIL